MSGNLTFNKTPEYFYNLVFDFQNILPQGEIIKKVEVFVNDTQISGSYDVRYSGYINGYVDNSGIYYGSGNYDSIFAIDCVLYDNDTITIKTNNGVLNSGYQVKVNSISNRRITYSKTIDVYIDDISTPHIYNKFEYRFLTDNYDLYILPGRLDSTTPEFDYNTEYTVNINKNITSINALKLLNNETFWFTSKMCPMFTYANIIIMKLGVEGEKFTEDTINRYIHRTSMEAIDLMNMSPSCDGGHQYSYDKFGCTPEYVPYNLKRYVECKVTYDLINILNRLRLISGTAGGQTKSLGDMTIKYNSTLMAPIKGPNPLQDAYNCFMALQNILSNSSSPCGTGAGISVGTRGKYDVSKGFEHPSADIEHHRVNKPKPPADGPWYNSTNYRYPMSYTPPKPSRRDIF